MNQSNRTLTWIFVLTCCLNGQSLLADGLHMRAREHYEKLNLSTAAPDTRISFEGFTNTINLWYERPFVYAFGLAGSPLFATLPRGTGAATNDIGQRIRIVHLGLEAKAFMFPEHWGVFARVGVYHAALGTQGLYGTLAGLSQLIGLGYEWNVHGIGIAPEMSWRRASFAKGLGMTGTAPAIGLHFYQLI